MAADYMCHGEKKRFTNEAPGLRCSFNRASKHRSQQGQENMGGGQRLALEQEIDESDLSATSEDTE